MLGGEDASLWGQGEIGANRRGSADEDWAGERALVTWIDSPSCAGQSQRFVVGLEKSLVKKLSIKVAMYLPDIGKPPFFCDSTLDSGSCLHAPSLSSNHVLGVETTQSSLQQRVNGESSMVILLGHRGAQNLPDGDPSLPPGSVRKRFGCSC